MAQMLLYHLNRLQDILNLPRSTQTTYPDNTDPQHSDNILTEDVWEAAKTIVADQARRGVMDVSVAYTPVTTSVGQYALPGDVCKLLAIEYHDGSYWQNPMSSLVYNDFQKLARAESTGNPQYYSIITNNSHSIIKSGTVTAANNERPLKLYDTSRSFAVTNTGEMINYNDIVYNGTTDAIGAVEYLSMNTKKLEIPVGDISSAVSTDFAAYDVATSPTIVITKAAAFSGNELLIRAGDIIEFPLQKAWLVITNSVYSQTSTANDTVTITTDSVIRGKDHGLDWPLTTVGGSGNILDAPINIGVADIVAIQGSADLIDDAFQGLQGGTQRTLTSYSVALADSTVQYYNNGWVFEHAGVNLSTYGYLPTKVDTPYRITIVDGNINSILNRYYGYVGASLNLDPPLVSASLIGLTLFRDAALQTAGLNDSAGNAITGTLTNVLEYEIGTYPLEVNDSYQIELQQATVDTINIYPLPDRTDTTGTESLKVTYIAYPPKPTDAFSLIALDEAYNDALLAKALEYSTRREIGQGELYDIALRRATSAVRPAPPSALIRNNNNNPTSRVNWTVE